MSGRLCRYKQQQHSKLYFLSLCSKCSPFAFTHSRRPVFAPLPDCRINNALIQFVPSYQAVSKADIFSDVACNIISRSRGNFFYAGCVSGTHFIKLLVSLSPSMAIS